MNTKLLIANIVIVAIVLGALWCRNQFLKRSETRRANGQMRLLGPTDELSELTQVVRQWADTTGVLKNKPDVLPDFGSESGEAKDDDASHADNKDSDGDDDVDSVDNADEEESDKQKVS